MYKLVLLSPLISVGKVIFTSTTNAIGGLVSVLVHCKPIAATWNPKLGECGSLEPLMKLSYAFTAVAIMSDCICAIIPFFLISKMNMKAKKKWGVIGVLSVGICACIFTMARVPYLKYYLIPEDQLCEFPFSILGHPETSTDTDVSTNFQTIMGTCVCSQCSKRAWV